MFKSLFAAIGALVGAPIGISGTPHRVKRRPTGAALRNPADPTQAARIEAAAVKRARRADKLQLRTRAIKNMTHRNCANTNSLNPFYVAK